MADSIELKATRCDGLEKWSTLLRNKLNFSIATVSVPEGKDKEQFEGIMSIDEMNHGVLKALVSSSAQRVSLAHQDIFSHKKSKIFIINSCNGLLFSNKTHRKIISVGDSIIIPSWDNFTEECFTNRNSVSIILDVSSITDSPNENIQNIIWKKVSELNYGTELNKLMSNYLSCHEDKFCEKNTTALLSLLALELEYNKKQHHAYSQSKKDKLPLIVDYIKNNIKDPELCLSSVANYFGLTERRIQYILSDSGIRFGEFLSKERCDFLASKIRGNLNGDINTDIFEAGFGSFSTASRQFQKNYNLTPRQYWDRLRMERK
ncbi:AraC family transcriptional regulator [Salmonella enterica subsp. enterica serovar Newport]|nr:AraC family transcriptional regulator [Salmonella enterica subsp. enterica serovar Newport]EBI8251236.1 AraC family transcriptional regulator [Salmonella enterica]EBQ8643771.1 AraC family transcriptional regulator [Salmonella enterica subsp. enterica serovar Reading]EBW7050602.1 AraC family transcriptional regulator [Salmonella enterica subsp. enterica serovar Muenchen]EEB0062559.1 helix-turn-helix transcriptional regulator [Salmonella enterica subsp. enterica serovar Brandenburg]